MTAPRHRARTLATTLATTAAALALVTTASAAPDAPGRGTLPDNRAYELVTPPDRGGSDIAADSRRTRAAADGSALQFGSLAAFGDAVGTGVTTDYMALRSTAPNPGSNGWSTHAITPKVGAQSLQQLGAEMQPLYVGELSADLNAGIFFSPTTPLTNDPNVAAAMNLYRRADLRTPGTGSYNLVTRCPTCEAPSGTPLPPNARLRPQFAGASPGFDKALFESDRPLTVDASAGAVGTNLYEWADGRVQLVGRIPASPATECDDSAGGSACVVADVSIAGQGAGTTSSSTHQLSLTPHVISDGSDGHSRIFFSNPTSDGVTSDPAGFAGNVYMRVDGTHTVQLNVSENSSPTAYWPATFLDASRNGQRAYFSSAAQLTDNAPADGVKLYMYDATKDSADADNLTLLSVDANLADGADLRGFIGSSADGHYVYMVVDGQLVSGAQVLGGRSGIYLWHDGDISFIGSIPNDASAVYELQSSGPNYFYIQPQARVTPDGRHMLFSAYAGEGLTGYDHGSCGPFACRELYVYSADTGALACASCDASGAAATAMTETMTLEIKGGSVTSSHANQTFSDDGSFVFFNTTEALVPEDANGKVDAYEYDVVGHRVHLLSSGTSSSDSWFLEASANGKDVFIETREHLVGWDVDDAYDIYDARVDGGFPDPPPAANAACTGDSCQAAPVSAPGVESSGSTAQLTGGGNVASGRAPKATTKAKAKSKGKPKASCRKGYVRKRVKGKSRCVKKPRAGRAARHATRSTHR